MKYDAKRHLLYPVLAPNNDDYPDGEFTTEVTLMPDPEPEGTSTIEIKFLLDEPYLAQAVGQGQAKCKAMVYCTSTLHRSDHEALVGEFSISAAIPNAQLDGTVEVHSFITSVEEISLDSDSIHPEYRNLDTPLRAGRKQPIAAAHRQEFNVVRKETKEDPIIIFAEDDEGRVPSGELDISTEISERQIQIIMHKTTYEQVAELRKDTTLALASVYMSALVQACCRVDHATPEEAEGASPNGWFLKIKALQREGIEPFRMAQIIFDRPFEKLLGRATPERITR